jgi:hypothetical protein
MGDETGPIVTDNGENGTSSGQFVEPQDVDMVGGPSDGPPSLGLPVGLPSPLTGCYLLIIIGEPYSEEHKDIILQKLLKGKPIYLQFLILLYLFSA